MPPKSLKNHNQSFKHDTAISSALPSSQTILPIGSESSWQAVMPPPPPPSSPYPPFHILRSTPQPPREYYEPITPIRELAPTSDSEREGILPSIEVTVAQNVPPQQQNSSANPQNEEQQPKQRQRKKYTAIMHDDETKFFQLCVINAPIYTEKGPGYGIGAFFDRVSAAFEAKYNKLISTQTIKKHIQRETDKYITNLEE